MKSLAELAAIRDRMKDQVILRKGFQNVRVVVGMGTCGIAAGARDVLNTLVEGVYTEGLTDQVTVTQNGSVGDSETAPVVEVYEAGKDPVTYVKMDVQKAQRMIAEHLKGGKVVSEFTTNK